MFDHHLAMATRFEVVLHGAVPQNEDDEHLTAVIQAVWVEIDRVEQLLSRFDPTSEIARINREAQAKPVRVDWEVWEILCTCQAWCEATSGAFDITATARIADATKDHSPAKTPCLLLDPSTRSVRLTASEARIDLGAFGKGYALDRAAEIIRAHGIQSALLNAGTSSILAIGHPRNLPHGWPIDVRDPNAPLNQVTPNSAPSIARLTLKDRAFSCSGIRHAQQAVSDIIDPTRGTPLAGSAACVAIAATAAIAEILSTALLVLGRDRAASYTKEHGQSDGRNDWHIAWIDCPPNEPIPGQPYSPATTSPILQWLSDPL